MQFEQVPMISMVRVTSTKPCVSPVRRLPLHLGILHLDSDAQWLQTRRDSSLSEDLLAVRVFDTLDA